MVTVEVVVHLWTRALYTVVMIVTFRWLRSRGRRVVLRVMHTTVMTQDPLLVQRVMPPPT